MGRIGLGAVPRGQRTIHNMRKLFQYPRRRIRRPTSCYSIQQVQSPPGIPIMRGWDYKKLSMIARPPPLGYYGSRE
ncbi:hypothetical protein IG631_05065 [Alternaria alternata]|nr:hypothetical protein IG631_05065 [Alternaria alternata]